MNSFKPTNTNMKDDFLKTVDDELSPPSVNKNKKTGTNVGKINNAVISRPLTENDNNVLKSFIASMLILFLFLIVGLLQRITGSDSNFLGTHAFLNFYIHIFGAIPVLFTITILIYLFKKISNPKTGIPSIFVTIGWAALFMSLFSMIDVFFDGKPLYGVFLCDLTKTFIIYPLLPDYMIPADLSNQQVLYLSVNEKFNHFKKIDEINSILSVLVFIITAISILIASPKLWFCIAFFMDKIGNGGLFLKKKLK